MGDQNYLEDKSGMIFFRVAKLRMLTVRIMAFSTLTAGRYRLVLKIPVSLGFTPAECSGCKTEKWCPLIPRIVMCTTMYITLSARLKVVRT